MAKSTKAIVTVTLPRRSRLDKKLRRKARHIARKEGRTMERVIDHSAATLRKAGSVPVHTQIERLYREAVHDMDKRLTLTGKDRRALNVAEFNVTLPSAGDMYKAPNNPKWRGKRDWLSTKPTEGYLAAKAILAARAAN